MDLLAFSFWITLPLRFLGKWEMDRGSQYLGYDFWWHITRDTLLTSEWGTPNQIENGVIPEELLQGRYGHQVHVHPTPIRSLQDLYEHAAIGPIPGQIVLAIGFLFHAGLVALAIFTLKGQRAVGRVA